MELRFKYERYGLGSIEPLETVTFEKHYSLTANYPCVNDYIMHEKETYRVVLRTWDYENEVIYYKLERI